MPSARAAVRFVTRNAPLLVAAALGVAWFALLAGPQALNPLNTGWVMTGEDWTGHAFGWWFFRNEPWALPLGRIDGLLFPLGTTVGFTDAIPWVAVLLKPLSPLLPDRFHYIGLWLGFCFAANGASGAWVARRLGGGVLAQVGTGALLATTPIFLNRMGHEALCAHFILVLLVGLHLSPPRPWPSNRRDGLLALGLVVLAGGIHPYLAAMALPLAMALPVQRALVDRTAPPLTALVWPAAMIAALALTFLVFGFFTGEGDLGAHGFGFFDSDLFALFNPRNFSRLLPALPSPRGHYEGYGYLGAGTFGICAVALVLWAAGFRRLRRVRWLRYLPLTVVTLGALVFALGPEVKAGTTVLFRAGDLYEPLGFLTGPFRSSGRFIWVLHYAVGLAAVAALLRGAGRFTRLAGVVLVAAAALQAFDTSYDKRGLFHRKPVDAGLRSDIWRTFGAEYRHLVLVPPQIAWTGAPCEGEIPGHARYPLAYLAYEQRMTFNSGSVARLSTKAAHAQCAQVKAQTARGELEPHSVYVARGPSGHAMRRGGAVCGRVDGYDVCVAPARSTALSRRLSGDPAAAPPARP